jgi:hypothetical protein
MVIFVRIVLSDYGSIVVAGSGRFRLFNIRRECISVEVKNVKYEAKNVSSLEDRTRGAVWQIGAKS